MIEERPWGYFTVLEEKNTHKIKRIVVYAGQRLSYQSHEKRLEDWIFTRGEGVVTIDGVEHLVQAGSRIRIPTKAKHRVKNTCAGLLEFVEIQTGDYFGEDDIIRYSDDYGRSDA